MTDTASSYANPAIFGRPGDPLGMYLKLKQQAENKKLAQAAAAAKKRQDDQKALEDGFKWDVGKTWEIYGRPLKEGVQEYRNQYRAMVGAGGAPRDVFYNPQMVAQRQKLERYKASADALQSAYTDLHKLLDSERGKLKDKQYLLSEAAKMAIGRDENGKLDIENTNLEGLATLFAHPRGLDPMAHIRNEVEMIKQQMSDSETSPLKRSALGQYVTIESNTARFKRPVLDAMGNPTGDYEAGVSDEFVSQMLGNSRELGERLRYGIAEQLASETGRSAEEEYFNIKDDPSFGPQVHENLKRLIENFQQVETKNDYKNAFKNHAPRAGRQTREFNTETVSAGYTDLKNYDEIGDDGIAGYESMSIPIPNLEKGIPYDDYTWTVDGFRLNKDGKSEIMIHRKSGGGEEEHDAMPMDEFNLANVRNAHDTEAEKERFDELVKRTQRDFARAKKFVPDEQALHEVLKKFNKQWDRVKNGGSKKAALKVVNNILEEHGLPTDRADISYTGKIMGFQPPFLDHGLKLNGASFNLDTKKGFKDLKKWVFDQNKESFIAEKTPQKQKIVPPDRKEGAGVEKADSVENKVTPIKPEELNYLVK